MAAPAGGEGAPDLQESVQNFGINSAALAVLSFLLWRDFSKERADIQTASREEGLARLQVRARPRVHERGYTSAGVSVGGERMWWCAGAGRMRC